MNGTRSWKSARLGIVYRNAEKSPNGVSNQCRRCASRAAKNAMAKPIETAIAVR